MPTPDHTPLEPLRDASGHPVDPCDMLDEVVLLRDMPYQNLSILAKYLYPFRAQPGTVLFEEGKRSELMYFLVEGRLSVFKEDEHGVRHQLATIPHGKSVGEMSLIDRSPHSATVISDGEVILLQLSQQELARLRDEHPRLAFELLLQVAQLLSFRLRHTSGQLVDYLD